MNSAQDEYAHSVILLSYFVNAVIKSSSSFERFFHFIDEKNIQISGFTCERWVTIFHPLKRHIICTKRMAMIIMTSLTLGSMTFYSFTLFIYKVKTFPNGRKVCLMVYKFLVLSKVGILKYFLTRSKQFLFC